MWFSENWVEKFRNSCIIQCFIYIFHICFSYLTVFCSHVQSAYCFHISVYNDCTLYVSYNLWIFYEGLWNSFGDYLCIIIFLLNYFYIINCKRTVIWIFLQILHSILYCYIYSWIVSYIWYEAAKFIGYSI